MVSFSEDERYQLVKGDICDRGLVEQLFNEHEFSGVFHFAAESHVDNSISGPEAFIKTNVNGTFTLLDVARNHWMEAPGKVKTGKESARFLHVSTDEVYGSLGKEGLFTEETPYAPNSPYSASKASSDFIVRSYFHTYGMNVVTTNCSNNYGPNQHDEKLIPTIIRNAVKGNPIPIYGDGQNVRDWLFVTDHCTGIQLSFEQGRSGETYNIGGRNERNNLYIAQTICEILDRIEPSTKSYKEQITFVTDRPGHDLRYAIDASKIEGELGWKAKENFESGIEKTIKHYLEKYL
jgi:dTDP-glucose 4,6-dehydratase